MTSDFYTERRAIYDQLVAMNQENGYVLVPDNMLEDLQALSVYLDNGHEYVMSLEPK